MFQKLIVETNTPDDLKNPEDDLILNIQTMLKNPEDDLILS